MRIDIDFIKALISFLFLLILAWLFLSLSGCSLFRTSQSSFTDTSKTVTTDSGKVTRSEANSRTNAEWWRETITFPRDSVYIEKTSQPVNHYITQPVQIIREGGTVQVETKQINYDSLFNSKLEQIAAVFKESESKTKGSVLGFWQTFGLVILGAVLIFGLSKVIKFNNPLKHGT